MRVALHDFTDLIAMTTIEFPNEALHSPDPAQIGALLYAGHAVTLRLVVVPFYLPRENKHNPARTFAAIPADKDTSDLVRFVFGADYPTIPPQHRPQAVRMIREALKMGEA